MLITSEEDEVVVRHDLEGLDLGLRDDHAGVAPVLDLLGLDVAEGARDAQPAGEHAEGAQYQLLLYLVRGVGGGDARYRLGPKMLLE